MAKPLWQQLYFDEVYTEARIIGYAGITPFGFQDAFDLNGSDTHPLRCFYVEAIIVEKEDVGGIAAQGIHYVLKCIFIGLDLACQMRGKMMIEGIGQHHLIHQAGPMERIGIG